MNPPTQKLTALVFLLLSVVLVGCQSDRFAHWVSPQISGRVLAADTQQPLAGVLVTLVGAGQVYGSPKGGQVLMQPNPVRTDGDGQFVLPAESVLAVLRQPGWWSVPVVFTCSGYESFQMNYTGTNVTSHSAEGMPEVKAGDVLLHPLAR